MSVYGMKIALYGFMRSGKDTVGQFLINRYNFQRFAFGDGIREVCRRLFPEQMQDAKPRALLQGVGQDLRKYDENVWVKDVLRKIKRTTNEFSNIVITDLRQPNEYEELRKNGFCIVQVLAPESEVMERMKKLGDKVEAKDLQHETESHYDKYEPDFIIVNDGSLKDLGVKVDRLVKEVSQWVQ